MKNSKVVLFLSPQKVGQAGNFWTLLRTPEGGRLRPKEVGQLSYARVAREGLQVVVVCDKYPESQTSKKKTLDVQQAIGWLVDELPEKWFTPRLVDSYWAKGAAVMACHNESTKDWLAARVTTLVAWESSRLKTVRLDALPTYNSGGLVSSPCGGVHIAASQAEPGSAR